MREKGPVRFMSLLRKMPQMRRMPNEISFYFYFIVWHKRVREKGPVRLMSLLKKMPQMRRMPNEISFYFVLLSGISACERMAQCGS